MSIIDDDMRTIVESSGVCYVATICEDGSPNQSPKGTLRVWDDEHLVFLNQASPNTVANLRRDPRLEINAVDVFRRRGYRFKGTAELRGPGDDVFEALHQWLIDTHGPGYPAHEAVFVTVERALPVDSPAYEWGHAAEADLVEAWSKRYQEALKQPPSAPLEQSSVEQPPVE